MNKIQTSVIKTIAYFDIFNYPLTAQEVHSFLDIACDEQQVQKAITELANQKIIFKAKEFYSLQCDDEQAAMRLADNAEATKQLLKAQKIATLITKFPFIRAVAVSGSLSKNVANAHSDFDYFIITKANRLWVSRLFFTCLVKAASIFGFGRYFCLNYIIDEQYLEVQEKNIFTATEVITLKPMYGQQLLHAFFKTNNWVNNFFPNNRQTENKSKEFHASFFASIIEKIFNGNFGEKADNYILRFCQRRWKKMMAKQKFTKTGFQLGAMMADKHFCRPYPHQFQKKIIDKHQEKVTKLNANINAAYSTLSDDISVVL